MSAQAYLRSEIDRFRVAAGDLREAQGGAMHLAEIAAGKLDRMYGFAARALETGVIVSYARPFTRHGIGQLDKDMWAPSDEEEAKLHHAIIRLRNIRYAHTDKKEGLRGTEDVFGTGHYAEAWSSLGEDAWPRIMSLAEGQAAVFDSLANRLQAVLRELG